MLTVVMNTPFTNKAFNYIQSPDISDNQWFTRGRGEKVVFLCDKEILLTEELKLYLNYFNASAGKNIGHRLASFSNIPIKGASC